MRWSQIGNAIFRLSVCSAAVLAVTVVIYVISFLDRPFTAALFFLFIVLIVSTVWGLRYAVFASFLAALGFSWVSPPLSRVYISDSRDIFALAAFLVTGILTNYLSDRARRRTERLRQLEADLAHINRVTTMGELTASLAHEVNQPIAAAMTNAYACMLWLARENPDIEEAREAARRIVTDAQRAGEIISRIRQLFTKGTPQRELVNVNAVINEIVALLGDEAARHGVSIRSQLAADLPQVMGDHVQLQQVLMNLLLNSVDAMKAVDGTREISLTSHCEGSDHLLVSVSDTGIGLPPEIGRIFDAFFTTKPHGTGMGLAISRTIIESHGGRLWATANSGQGTIFYFTLPTNFET
jgi:signal transduction histidine kinase